MSLAPDLLGAVAARSSLSTLSSALRGAGLVSTLRDDGPFTLFAPTDQAFSEISETTLAGWLKQENRLALREVLTYHILPGRLTAQEIIKSSSARTMQGKSLTIRFTDNRMHVNQARVTQVDIECRNGVIHLIDAVLIPR